MLQHASQRHLWLLSPVQDRLAHVANGLLQKARSGDTTSAIFYLKTQGGWRETDRLEHTGAGGGPVTKIVREIVRPSDKLRAFLDETADRLQVAGPEDGKDR